jgi:hypothetical protein
MCVIVRLGDSVASESSSAKSILLSRLKWTFASLALLAFGWIVLSLMRGHGVSGTFSLVVAASLFGVFLRAAATVLAAEGWARRRYAEDENPTIAPQVCSQADSVSSS